MQQMFSLSRVAKSNKKIGIPGCRRSGFSASNDKNLQRTQVCSVSRKSLYRTRERQNAQGVPFVDFCNSAPATRLTRGASPHPRRGKDRSANETRRIVSFAHPMAIYYCTMGLGAKPNDWAAGVIFRAVGSFCALFRYLGFLDSLKIYVHLPL